MRLPHVRWTFLRRNRSATLLNLFGLTIGLTAALLIALYVLREYSTDKHQPQSERLMRVEATFQVGKAAPQRLAYVSPPVGPLLLRELPGVESFVRINQRAGGVDLKYGENTVASDGVAWADSTFFDMISAEVVRGDVRRALNRPGVAVLSEEYANALFGDSNPIGQQLTQQNGETVEVTAVYRPSTKPTQLVQPGVIFSYLTLGHDETASMLNNNFITTFVRLHEGFRMEELKAQLDALVERREGERLGDHASYSLRLNPITDAYFDTEYEYGAIHSGSLATLRMLSAIGLFILLIAVLNYINLSTALAHKRARQVGISKTVGATRQYLMTQFLFESVSVTLLASLLSLAAAQALLDYFNNLAATSITIPWASPAFLLLLLGLAVIVGVAAGAYPALILSSYRPITVLKGSGSGKKGNRLRSALVTLQFTISALLILGTLVVQEQLEYTRTANLGFQRERVMLVDLGISKQVQRDYKTFEEQIRQVQGVEAACAALNIPGLGMGDRGFRIPSEGPDASFWTRAMYTKPGFLEVLGVEPVIGRSLDPGRESDLDNVILLNETAVKKLGWEENPLGQILEMGSEENPHPLEVIGVLPDFHYQSLHEEIAPLAIVPSSRDPWLMAVRIAPGQVETVVEQVRRIWEEREPEREENFFFLDDAFDRLYRSEQRLGTLVTLFTGLAIVIASLGLFALSAYAAQQRTREIGVRKVLGAEVPGLVWMLVMRFLILVGMANLIAWPVAWWVSNRWLMSFAYHIHPDIGLFLLTGAASLVLAVISVGSQAWKAATINPVETLRHE